MMMPDVIGAAAFGVVVGMLFGAWTMHRWVRDELRTKTGIQMKMARIIPPDVPGDDDEQN